MYSNLHLFLSGRKYPSGITYFLLIKPKEFYDVIQ